MKRVTLERTKGKRPPVFIGEYLTEIDKAGGKPVALKKPKPETVTVNFDGRINIP